MHFVTFMSLWFIIIPSIFISFVLLFLIFFTIDNLKERKKKPASNYMFKINNRKLEQGVKYVQSS